MEEVELTAEQFQVLTAAGAAAVEGQEQEVQLAYLTEDGTQLHPLAVAGGQQQHLAEQQMVIQQGQQQVLVQQQPEQQVLVREADGDSQVLVVDSEKCFYVEGGEEVYTQVLQGHDAIQQQVEAQTTKVVSVQEGQEVDLQALLQAGAISAQDFAALSSGATVATAHQQEGEESIVIQQQEHQEEEAAEPVQVVRDEEGNLLQVVVQPGEDPTTAVLQHQQQATSAEEGFLIQCGKCERTFQPCDFDRHFEEVHAEDGGDSKACSICGKHVSRRDYLDHFKSTHADVRLGCPKCPQTYHSPDLLNVHYKHFHLKEDEEEEEEGVQSDPGGINLLAVAAEDPLSENLGLEEEEGRTLQKRRLCGAKDPLSQEEHPGERRSKKSKPAALECQVCLKSFPTQRDFTNHRRRKGFCKPPAKAPPPQTRRIGIIRKSL